MATCIVTGTVVDKAEQPVEDAVVRANLVTQLLTDDGKVVTKDMITATTDENGEFSLTLIRSSGYTSNVQYKITIVECGYAETVTIPDQATVDIKDL